MRYALITAVVATVGIAHPVQGETIRCGSWIVDTGITVQELVRKCGEPASKRTEEQDVRVRTPNDPNSNTKRIGTTVIEYWTYDRGSSTAPALVTIRDGKVSSIEVLR